MHAIIPETARSLRNSVARSDSCSFPRAAPSGAATTVLPGARLTTKLRRPVHPFAEARPPRRGRYAIVALAFAFWAGFAPIAAAADDTVTLNFVNADIEAVVKAVAEITGRNFLIDPRVKGSINIISARPVPKSLVYPTLLSALRLQGFAVVEGDGVVKIVPEADAKQQGGTVAVGPLAAGGDRLVTQVITLKFESAAQLVNVLRPLITPNNTIAAFPGSNALVITDYADNLRRIDRIIASLDQAPGAEPILVPLRNASALDIVTLLNRLLADPGAAGSGPIDAQQRVTIMADARSNSVLVRADNPGRLVRVRQLIEQLDTPGRPGGNMFIVYLKNAEAARVAQTLRAMLSGGDSGGTASGSGLSQAPPLFLGNAPMAGAVPTATPATAPLASRAARRRDELFRERRDDHRRHGEQRARHHGVGTCVQQPPRDHREARRAARAGVRRGADRRGVGGQGGGVRHPVAGALRLQLDADARDRRHQLHAARQRQQHHRRRRESRATSGKGSRWA